MDGAMTEEIAKYDKPSNERQMFDALKRITKYDSTDQLQRNCERRYGLTYTEALEMAYENVVSEARQAIYGKRRPR